VIKSFAAHDLLNC